MKNCAEPEQRAPRENPFKLPFASTFFFTHKPRRSRALLIIQLSIHQGERPTIALEVVAAFFGSLSPPFLHRTQTQRPNNGSCNKLFSSPSALGSFLRLLLFFMFSSEHKAISHRGVHKTQFDMFWVSIEATFE